MIELGLGAAEALSRPGTGRVIGVYRKAAYLRVPGGLFALTTTDGVPSGPLHARTSPPAELDGLRVGDRVTVTPNLLEAGPILVDLRGARRWRGEHPAALPAPAGPALDLPSLADRFGGRGPGLTPAGDDILAGLLLVARMRDGAAAEESLLRLAVAVATNDIARAFLVWAARGQSIEPVHRFLVTGAADALAELERFGHSSGRALAYGLRLGLQRPFTCNRAVTNLGSLSGTVAG